MTNWTKNTSFSVVNTNMIAVYMTLQAFLNADIWHYRPYWLLILYDTTDPFECWYMTLQALLNDDIYMILPALLNADKWHYRPIECWYMTHQALLKADIWHYKSFWMLLYDTTSHFECCYMTLQALFKAVINNIGSLEGTPQYYCHAAPGEPL